LASGQQLSIVVEGCLLLISLSANVNEVILDFIFAKRSSRKQIFSVFLISVVDPLLFFSQLLLLLSNPLFNRPDLVF
jgi:hypothetical protein